MGVTTATLWVCSNCGHVDRLEGHGGSGQMNQFCPPVYSPVNPVDPGASSGAIISRRHSLKPVVVVVPYA